MKIKANHKNDSSSIMLRSFLILITVIILASSITIITAVGHQLLDTSESNATEIIKSLKKTVIDGDKDWNNWVLNNTLDTSTSYVKVHNMRKNAAVKHFYSPNTKKLLSKRMEPIPVIKNLYYRKNIGLIYYATGHARGINYQLWLNVNEQLETLESVVIITIIILILALLIVPLYIRFIAVRLTNPLAQLTNSAENLSNFGEYKTEKLPIPTKPTEVNNLASSFNNLLTRLYKQSEQEKLFVSNAAHELRTPIATIRSHAQLIQRRGRQHPEIISKSIDYINDESYQMQTLVEELLTLSRADRMTLDLDNFDLSQALKNIAAKMTPLLKQELITEIENNITIQAHEASIEQIVMNLLNNAGKYSAADTVISLTLTKSNGHVMVQVSDNGSGISTADKQHIFERFYRSNEIRGSIPGTGLGLAIAKQLADLNHASLTVTDNQPQGTIFSLIFDQPRE